MTGDESTRPLGARKRWFAFPQPRAYRIKDDTGNSVLLHHEWDEGPDARPEALVRRAVRENALWSSGAFSGFALGGLIGVALFILALQLGYSGVATFGVIGGVIVQTFYLSVGMCIGTFFARRAFRDRGDEAVRSTMLAHGRCPACACRLPTPEEGLVTIDHVDRECCECPECGGRWRTSRLRQLSTVRYEHDTPAALPKRVYAWLRRAYVLDADSRAVPLVDLWRSPWRERAAALIPSSSFQRMRVRLAAPAVVLRVVIPLAVFFFLRTVGAPWWMMLIAAMILAPLLVMRAWLLPSRSAPVLLKNSICAHCANSLMDQDFDDRLRIHCPRCNAAWRASEVGPPESRGSPRA